MTTLAPNQVVYAPFQGSYRRCRVSHVHDWESAVTLKPTVGDTIITKRAECITEEQHLWNQGQVRAREQFKDFIPIAESCKTVEEFQAKTKDLCMKGPATRKWNCLKKWRLI